MERTLDRLVEFDDASRDYPIRELLAQPVPRSYSWRCETWLDQGSEGACVGFAWAHELAARPVVIPTTNLQAHNIYKEAQKVDEWPGEDYSGTSVLAGAKVLNTNKLMDEYRWAFGIQDVILAIGYKGPGVFGINWWTGMFKPNEEGFIAPVGEIAGGHAILGRSVRLVWMRGTSMIARQSPEWFNYLDQDLSYITLHNSWGQDWGVNGDAKVTIRNMDALLKEQGEFCIPVRRSRAVIQ